MWQCGHVHDPLEPGSPQVTRETGYEATVKVGAGTGMLVKVFIAAYCPHMV